MSADKQLGGRSLRRAATLCAAILMLAVAAWAQGAGHENRILQDLSTGGTVRLPGSVHRLTRHATDLGRVNPSIELRSVTLHFGLSPQQQIDMDALTLAQQDPKSPLYHHWLTQEEYGARFGMTASDLAQVTRWLQTQGLSVLGISKTRNSLSFRGQAWQVESAFHTQLHRYEWDGESHFANATELQIPAALRGIVLVARGLHSFRPRPQLRHPSYTVNTTNGIMNFLTPSDWATIYNVNALYNAGLTGANAYVGVVGQTYAPQSDIDHFRSASQLPATKLTYVCIYPSVAAPDSTTCTATHSGDLGEADLDIEWAGGIAKNATVVYLYAPGSKQSITDPNSPASFPLSYDVFDALYQAVNDYKVPATNKVLPVISMSYTDCEQDVTGSTAYSTWISQTGSQANVQGQTIVVSSGDTGAAGCDGQSETQAIKGKSATVPVDSPAYTGVGGTTLSGDKSTPSQYWNEVVNQIDTALKYIPETVWNDSGSGSLSTSGGGVSTVFAKPAWQPTPANYSGPSGRFVPDVAFAASAEHDGYMNCSQDNSSTDCTNGFFNSTSHFFPAGGTSAGAPSFAGMLTLLDQKYGPQGNINPMLYAMASDPATYAAVFHDVGPGSNSLTLCTDKLTCLNNVIPCQAGTTGCIGGAGSTPGTMGFAAGTGYDLTTGLGSIDGGTLLTAMGTPGTAAATTTTLKVSPGEAQLDSSTLLTLTASVTSAAAETINGQVSFSVNGTTLGTALLSGGTATLGSVSVSSANGFTAGTDTISAQFAGGDDYFAPSSGTTPLTVTTGSGPQPLLSLSQETAPLNGPGFTLVVNGIGFASTSKVLWNGLLRSTTFVNSTQLLATIPGTDLTTEGTALITVSNAAPNPQTLGALPLAVISTTPVARIGSATLTVAADGSGNHVLTVTGIDFVSNSQVEWNGTGLTTSQLSPWQLSAVVTGAEFGARPAAVTVVNPAGSSQVFKLP